MRSLFNRFLSLVRSDTGNNASRARVVASKQSHRCSDSPQDEESLSEVLITHKTYRELRLEAHARQPNALLSLRRSSARSRNLRQLERNLQKGCKTSQRLDDTESAGDLRYRISRCSPSIKTSQPAEDDFVQKLPTTAIIRAQSMG